MGHSLTPSVTQRKVRGGERGGGEGCGSKGRGVRQCLL